MNIQMAECQQNNNDNRSDNNAVIRSEVNCCNKQQEQQPHYNSSNNNDDNGNNYSNNNELTTTMTTKRKQKHNQLFFFGLPTSVQLILFNELCERFAYYGNRAILTLFLTSIAFDEAKAVMVYSLSSALAYTMPLFGGYLADVWLGKYWTIIIFSLIYFSGALLLSFAALPTFWDSQNDPLLVYIALTFTAIGTGGIKPNISSFAAEQLEMENNKKRNNFAAPSFIMNSQDKNKNKIRGNKNNKNKNDNYYYQIQQDEEQPHQLQ